MSDWVAALIHDAIDGTLLAARLTPVSAPAVTPAVTPIAAVSLAPPEKAVETVIAANDEAPKNNSGRQLKTLVEIPPAAETDEVPRYSKPPFWA